VFWLIVPSFIVTEACSSGLHSSIIVILWIRSFIWYDCYCVKQVANVHVTFIVMSTCTYGYHLWSSSIIFGSVDVRSSQNNKANYNNNTLRDLDIKSSLSYKFGLTNVNVYSKSSDITKSLKLWLKVMLYSRIMIS
jgi:hypothetical protein